MEKNTSPPLPRRLRQSSRSIGIVILVFFLVPIAITRTFFTTPHIPPHAAATLARCQHLQHSAGPPPNFYDRTENDRFVPGTKPTLIKNAKIWTGLHNGTQVLEADILVDKGLIMGVGSYGHSQLEAYGSNLEVVDAHGAWVTPGIVDLHSHLGDYPSPELDGVSDGNSVQGTAQPWLRSLDGLNTHDDSYPLSIAGGVTTALILPGSANAIGGQAFVIKLRHTEERSPTSMLLEPPYQINNSFPDPSLPPRWRYMKVYGVSRMDTTWAFREAYNTASQIKRKQDAYCSKAMSGQWQGLGEYPEDLKWEALVDVIRGHVKVNIHCYEAVDLDDMVRLSNEFQFPIAAFHHAHETYLVPDLLKKAYGPTPAVALFATNGRYKREAYRQSEFASRILANNGLQVVFKSDHSVLNSRFLLYEAQQAHYYGLADNLAVASVTSTPAEIMGMGHRIGYVRKDLVIWDSHPLSLGATPSQVFIDGIPQLESAYVVHKPQAFQEIPRVPNFDDEVEETLKYDGLPPLSPSKSVADITAFTNVKSFFSRSPVQTIQRIFDFPDKDGVVLVRKGKVICSGSYVECFDPSILGGAKPHLVDLEGGSISPGLVSFGSPLGLENMDQEPSTNDGSVPDPLIKAVPKIIGGDTAIIRAVDGLQYTTRDALLAYRSGVTSAIVAPSAPKFYSGLGTFFSTGAEHKLVKGAVLQEITALHIAVRHFGTPSISTQIAALRRLLLGPYEGDSGKWFKKVTEGTIPLVVEAHSADVIATLVLLKREVKQAKGTDIRLTITGATEAHLLAKELGEAGVGVVLTPSRPFPYTWEDRRIEHSAISLLLSHNVTVGIGIEEIWSARNTRFDVAWVGGTETVNEAADLVATRGGDILELEAKVAAVISPLRGFVDIF
ncbi:carbohydrate esterase family 9 protein [Armillaria mellea]|nr:carbohydrate esterase family 9 protein [Armillaria mellea]